MDDKPKTVVVTSKKNPFKKVLSLVGKKEYINGTTGNKPKEHFFSSNRLGIVFLCLLLLLAIPGYFGYRFINKKTVTNEADVNNVPDPFEQFIVGTDDTAKIQKSINSSTSIDTSKLSKDQKFAYYIRLAYDYTALKQYQHALDAYKKFIEIYPDISAKDAYIYTSMGDLAVELNNAGQAKSYYSKAIKLYNSAPKTQDSQDSINAISRKILKL